MRAANNTAASRATGIDPFWDYFYWVGWPVCKAVTFGRYPNSLASSNGKNKNAMVSLVGVTVSLGIFLCFIY